MKHKKKKTSTIMNKGKYGKTDELTAWNCGAMLWQTDGKNK